uniref:Uncharacterized protein n=1 Tax=Brassica oleracea TaxID=3712 RepID=A0A3P6EXB5_BRAOL|nr:unnamed protein product [Brassica oleracea]
MASSSSISFSCAPHLSPRNQSTILLHGRCYPLGFLEPET